MMSGFTRPSWQGPRLEKEATSFALLDSLSPMPGLCQLLNGWTLSGRADGEIIVLGGRWRRDCLSEPPVPLLPAANTITISWLPLVGYIELPSARHRAPERHSFAR